MAELNEELRTAGFNADDGAVFGRKTRHAVYAFQKHHELATSGQFTPFMWALLAMPVELPERAEPSRIEVDLNKQVLYVVEDGQVVLVLPISSGSGSSYIGSNGKRQIATTPEGAFSFQRRVRGIRRAPLGTLYNPYYFPRRHCRPWVSQRPELPCFAWLRASNDVGHGPTHRLSRHRAAYLRV